ncbi:unnamed protein product [Acanthoscelides obtectus]|uniref:Uncharacterized protein n=1 Tax=Acanthoscelides obtectus TaxID=200917 RepID=A0A9P0LZF4_ACAOB|nr:unnamed protein product [Acanthoscelides obtectus]CAK1625124.1 hypothetical protein AOBTE_LOCUS2973 [Acanthoscelides obtectus]
MSITRKLAPSHFVYTADKFPLKPCQEFNDLGIIFDAKLTFLEHIETVTSKAYKCLGFIIRSCRDFNSSRTRILLYNSFVVDGL